MSAPLKRVTRHDQVPVKLGARLRYEQQIETECGHVWTETTAGQMPSELGLLRPCPACGPTTNGLPRVIPTKRGQLGWQ